MDRSGPQVRGLLAHAPLRRDHFTEALREFLNDGVQCMELRSQLYGVRVKTIYILRIATQLY